MASQTWSEYDADVAQRVLKSRIPQIISSLTEMGFKYCKKLELYISPDEIYVYLREGNRNIQKHLQLSPAPFVNYTVKVKNKLGVIVEDSVGQSVFETITQIRKAIAELQLSS